MPRFRAITWTDVVMSKACRLHRPIEPAVNRVTDEDETDTCVCHGDRTSELEQCRSIENSCFNSGPRPPAEGNSKRRNKLNSRRRGPMTTHDPTGSIFNCRSLCTQSPFDKQSSTVESNIESSSILLSII